MAIETPQFNGFLGGWLANEDRRQQMMERERSNAAYNALYDVYGAVAGDPVAYGQLEGIRRANDRAPLEMEALRIGNDAATTGLDQSRQMFPHTLREAELGNSLRGQTLTQNDASFPIVQEARRLSNTGARLGNEAVEMERGAADQERRRAALLSGVNMLQAVAGRGGDVGAAFDQLAPTLKGMGVPDDQIAAMRVNVAANPAVLGDIATSLREPGKKGADLTEADKYYQRKLGAEAAAAEAKVYDLERESERSIKTMENASAISLRSLDTLLQPDMIKDTFGFSTIGSYLPTSDYRAANNRLTALKDQIVVQMMQVLKAASPTGSTGFGNMTEREGARLENQFGKLDPYTSEEEGRKILQEVREQITSLPQRAREMFAREIEDGARKAEDLGRRVEEGTRPGARLRPNEGSSAGAVPLPPALAGAADGEVIQDDQGRSYVVRGGQLVPQ